MPRPTGSSVQRGPPHARWRNELAPFIDPAERSRLARVIMRRGTLKIHRRKPAVRTTMLPDYFGRIVGSPPGLPGGGITGILLPVSGVVARISGSTPVGGQSTPANLASLSLSGSLVVVPCGGWCLVASSIASASNPSHSSRTLAGPFEPVASLAYAEPARLPRRR